VKILPEWLPVSRLLIDRENFRLDGTANATQDDLLQVLDRDYQLKQIGESLADNGYFPQEPLVAIRRNSNFIVVEGNRRLAALKLLLEPRHRSLVKDGDFWEELQRRRKYEITEVPVIVFDNREDLTSFLGYRHVAGIVSWEPLPKARFITNLVEKRRDFESASDEIGCPVSVVRKNYIAYKALIQAREFRIDTSRLEQNFSVFFRALGYQNIAAYVGLRTGKTLQELKAPVPRSKRSKLADVISYVHGTEDEPPAMPESRDLKKLGEILADDNARRTLEVTRDFWKAYSDVGGESRKLLDNLLKAGKLLDEALVALHRHKRNRDVLAAVQRVADSFEQVIKQFPDIKVTTE
jgi:phosphoglycolate phosphatase-like HAD superfamily hydrolase